MPFVFQDGRELFMSLQSMKEIGTGQILVSKPALEDLEYVLNFESFPYKKTGNNIAKWLIDSHKDAGLKPGYVMHHATDGASNAKLSAEQFETLTRHLRDSSMTFGTCSAHQIHRAALYAAGDPTFKTRENDELHTALNKLHGIFERIRRSPARTKILDDVQKRAGR